MAKNTSAHSDLIDSIGSKIVSARFGLSPQALHNWRKRGIPPIKRVAFQCFAAEHGRTPPPDFLAPLNFEPAA